MKKNVLIKVLLLTIFALSTLVLFAVDTIPVVETSLKTKGEEVMYYGFAKGDKIVIDFTGYLAEIEVTFLPNTKVYSDKNISEISKKTIYVQKECVCQFKFVTNSSYRKDGHKNRVDNQKLIIQRIPKDESTIDFNTGWEWATINDTTYTYYTEDSLVGYDTLKYQERVKEITGKTKEEITLFDNVTTVKSYGIIVHDNPRERIFISLPRNETSEYMTKKVIAWAYWVGVGANATSALSNSNLKNAVTSAVGIVSPIGALAAGAIMELGTPKSGDNVKYAILDPRNADLFMNGQPYRYMQSGNGPGGYGRFTDENMCQGNWYICLYNDNEHNRINVTVKVSAIVETTAYKYVLYDRKRVTPKYVKVNRVKTTITPKRVMVNIK